MKKSDIAIYTLWMAVPVVIILSIFIAGCSPIAIREYEVIAEEIIEEVVKEDLDKK